MRQVRTDFMINGDCHVSTTKQPKVSGLHGRTFFQGSRDLAWVDPKTCGGPSVAGKWSHSAIFGCPDSGGPHIRFLFFWGRVPLDLRFRGPLEAKSFVRGRKFDPPGAPGRVFDLKCASCGHVRRCMCNQQKVCPRLTPDLTSNHRFARSCATPLRANRRFGVRSGVDLGPFSKVPRAG
jgi:hypothetical protein